MAGLVVLAVLALPAAAADARRSGGVTPDANLLEPTAPGPKAKLSRDGRTAIPPAEAPAAVRDAVYGANRITRRPYRYGGGHRRFRDTGYDCSGAVSYALHGGGILDSPLDSRAFRRWGRRGEGQWITVYTKPSHAYVVIAGLRFDTSGTGGRGPRWHKSLRSKRGYKVRHYKGL